MGWLLRHNWLWALLAFALGALITWFLVRRDPSQDEETGPEARPAAKPAAQPVRRREPVLVGAGGGGSSGPAGADRDPVDPTDEPVTGEHEPMGNDQESISADRQPVDADHDTALPDHEPVHGNPEPVTENHDSVHANPESVRENHDAVHANLESVRENHDSVHANPESVRENHDAAHANAEPVRGEEQATADRVVGATGVEPRSAPPARDADEPGAERWREPMHEDWELAHPDHDQPGRQAAVPQQPEPVSPVPSIDPASEFSERMENEPAPGPAKDGPAAQVAPVHGVPANGVLMDGVMGQPEGAGEVPPGRYGEGSADALPHQSAPDGYTIKGNEQSKLFHTPDSPYYGRTRPQVWFRTEADAERAGFTKYVREPHPLGN